MPTILGLPGSLRRGSYNAALLRAAAEVSPDATQVHVASIAGIPLYDGDLERDHGIPPVVSALKDRIARADALLLVTPEYNNGIPGVFKNAIDWLSRPPKDIRRVFGDKPVGLMGATPGRGGTRLAQLAWLPVFRTLGMRPWFGKQLHVGGAAEAFSEEGRLVDDKIRELLTEYIDGFARFVTGIPR
jgi:NAD(P)H-dependent FMN reductase